MIWVNGVNFVFVVIVCCKEFVSVLCVFGLIEVVLWLRRFVRVFVVFLLWNMVRLKFVISFESF